MLKTYHLKSAQDLSSEIIELIKDTFQSKSITIIVEEEIWLIKLLFLEELKKK